MSNIKPRVNFCAMCGTEYIYSTAYSKYCGDECRPTRLERSYSSMNGNPENYISFLLQKKGRERLSTEMLLELLEKQDGKCALSGVEMTFTKIINTPKVHTNLSIDRIDSSKEYTLDNVQLVCAITNIMKNTLTVEELKWWCTNIAEEINS